MEHGKECVTSTVDMNMVSSVPFPPLHQTKGLHYLWLLISIVSDCNVCIYYVYVHVPAVEYL